MDLSIIIVSYNTQVFTDECIFSIYQSLRRSSIKFEIILVDNNSKDDTLSIIRKKYPDVRIIKNTTNIGFGKANNQGIKISKGAYILLLNSDTRIQENAIEKLYEFARRHPKSFIAPKLQNPDLTDQPSCGPFFSLPVVFAVLFLRGDRIGITRYSPNRICKVDWASGACLMMKKDIVQNNLLFDTNIFLYMEEIDLLYRARKNGYTTYFYPSAIITHRACGSSKMNSEQTIAQIYTGMQYFYKKHYSYVSYKILKFFLKLKAGISIIIGIVLGNDILQKTYEKAYRMA